MKQIIVIISLLALAGCSVSLPQKQKAATTWKITPAKQVAEQAKDVVLVVAKPWIASGLDTQQVMVSSKAGNMDFLADVIWADSHQSWIRNYFLEGLQTSGLFSSVMPNHKSRGEHWVIQLYVWDLSVQYADEALKTQPVVKAKLAYSVTDRKGHQLIKQRTIEEHLEVSENRIAPIMKGFDTIVARAFGRIYQSLVDL